MGKYKSYIFLGVTLFFLMILGYFVAINSKKKKHQKADIVITKNNPPVTTVTPVTQVKPVSQEAVVTQEPVKTTKIDTRIGEGVQEPQQIPKTVKIPEIDVNLSVNNNNRVTWNPRLAESGISLKLIFERNGQVVESQDVSSQTSYEYIPGAEGDLKLTKVTLNVIGNVKISGNTSLKTREFTCTVH